jgi:hypothetical protein
MHKCLSSFNTYIQSRSSKIINVLSFLPKSSLAFYTIVHSNYQNNIGILFQFLPKIQYDPDLTTEYNPIICVDEYAKHTISFEELRYMDYSMNMKNKRHLGYVRQPTVKTLQQILSLSFPRSAIGNQGSCQILHSLPIVYPYDDSK